MNFFQRDVFYRFVFFTGTSNYIVNDGFNINMNLRWYPAPFLVGPNLLAPPVDQGSDAPALNISKYILSSYL